MRIHYLQHVPFEGPGVIQSWARRKNNLLTGTRLYGDEALPVAEDFQGLVVMGGPMGACDEKDFPWLEKEKQFIERCINQQIKVLGICLGAQLIADILGAEVSSMQHKEIGWYPLSWSTPARSHSLLDFLPARQTVLHWHGDQFDLPESAISLGASEGCANQGFVVEDQIIGLQFHLEMTKKGLSQLIDNSGNELETGTGPFIQSPGSMLNAPYFESAHQTMIKLLNRFFR